MANHVVVRLDKMAGTQNAAHQASVKFYTGSSDAMTAAAIDNGQLVVLAGKDGREVYKAVAPATGAKLSDLYLVAAPELFKDESKRHYLTEWENAAGVAVRAYHLVDDEFSVTAEAFDGTPAVGKYVGYKAGSTKILVQDSAVTATTFGKILEKETVGYGDGQYTFYMIKVC